MTGMRGRAETGARKTAGMDAGATEGGHAL